MPLLKVNKNGEVYQTDSRMNGVSGIGNLPQLVDADDVTSVSLLPDKNVQKDKQALARLEYMDRMNKIKKYAQDKLKENILEAAQKKRAEAEYQKKKVEEYQSQLFKNMSYLKARSTPGQEKLSGVSGNGLSADARQPNLSRASLDWAPIVTTDVAFGGSDDWGSSTNYKGAPDSTIGSPQVGVMPDDTPLNTWLPETKVTRNFSKNLYDTPEKRADALNQFKAGAFAVPLFARVGGNHIASLSFGSQEKERLHGLNNSFVGSHALSDFIEKNYAYSILIDKNGNKKIIPVSYVYGLPLINPHHTTTQYKDPEFMARLNGPVSKYGTEAVHNYEDVEKNGDYFRLLQPIILAAHEDYMIKNNLSYPDGSKVIEEPEVVRGSEPHHRVSTNQNFQHPMLKAGLLK